MLRKAPQVASEVSGKAERLLLQRPGEWLTRPVSNIVYLFCKRKKGWTERTNCLPDRLTDRLPAGISNHPIQTGRTPLSATEKCCYAYMQTCMEDFVTELFLALSKKITCAHLH